LFFEGSDPLLSCQMNCDQTECLLNEKQDGIVWNNTSKTRQFIKI
jgi:hypothetical protein